MGEDRRLDTAALAPRLAAELYDLDILASTVEDHPDNQTRFVALAPSGIPAPTGHDKTSIVCFQREDRPGEPSRHPQRVRGAEHQPDETRVPTDETGARRLLLSDRSFRAPGPRGRRRLSPGPPRRARRGQVPRLLPGRRRARTRRPPAGGTWHGRKPTTGSGRCAARSPEPDRAADGGPGRDDPHYPGPFGGMAERTNARLLKSLGPQGPGVRIPLPPPSDLGLLDPESGPATRSTAVGLQIDYNLRRGGLQDRNRPRSLEIAPLRGASSKRHTDPDQQDGACP